MLIRDMRRLFTAGVLLLASGALAMSELHGQAPQASDKKAPAFEVASVKPNTSGDPLSGTHNLPGGRVTITNERLRDIIRRAHGSNDLEVFGGPDWLDGDRWDIVAAAPPGDPDAPWQAMLKSLLVERFKLQAHVEQRERPIYKLMFARSDKRLGPDIHDSGCVSDETDCGRTTANTNGSRSGTIKGIGRTMADVAVKLAPYAGRRVFDVTGLAGRYDFELRWSEDVSIFTAVQEQLALKLESGRSAVDVVVIDHVERPTPD